MKKRIMTFEIEEDNSEIHKEAHKARLIKGELKRKAVLEFSTDKIKVKLKPKCSK